MWWWWRGNGRAVVGAIKSVGRGSFSWRIAQDQRALPLATARPLVGTGQWDWWRPQPSRPWGLAMLVLGQFGLIGCAFRARFGKAGGIDYHRAATTCRQIAHGIKHEGPRDRQHSAIDAFGQIIDGVINLQAL